ncbi:MAG: outer membrane beta-barrel protein [Burkholderiales bacterium]|nr:outer membrane beta-barrel protein [Burkholderiales bacterium]
MKQVIVKITTSTLIGAGFAVAANAQTALTGLYLEGSVGWTHANGDYARQVRDSLANSSTYQFASASYDNSCGTGGRIAAGWTVLPRLAVEVGYTDFGRDHGTLAGAAYKASTALTAYRKGRFHASANTLDAVAMLPVNKHLALNARLGVALTEQKYTQTNYTTADTVGQSADYPANRQTRLHWGVGASHNVTNHLSVVVNYTRIENVGHDFSSASIDKGTRAGKFGYGLLAAGLRYAF